MNKCIVLFGFRRLSQTLEQIKALLQFRNLEDWDVLINIDGPQLDSPERQKLIKIIDTKLAFSCKTLTKIFHECNLGLVGAIEPTLIKVSRTYDQFIVFEDDIEFDASTLDYFEETLMRFQEDPQVFTIQAYSPPIPRIGNRLKKFPFADCWGWATWGSKFNLIYEENAELILRKLQQSWWRRLKLFCAAPMDLFELLKQVAKGGKQSWAIKMVSASIIAGSVSVYPTPSFVRNIGFSDKLAENTKQSSRRYSLGQSISNTTFWKTNTKHISGVFATRASLVFIFLYNFSFFLKDLFLTKLIKLSSSRNKVG